MSERLEKLIKEIIIKPLPQEPCEVILCLKEKYLTPNETEIFLDVLKHIVDTTKTKHKFIIIPFGIDVKINLNKVESDKSVR